MHYYDPNTQVVANFKFGPQVICGTMEQMHELRCQHQFYEFMRGLVFTDEQTQAYHDRVLGIHRRLDKVLSK